MSTFQLSDKFGFSTDIQTGPAGLSSYFKSLPDWIARPINLKQLLETTWDDPTVVASHNLVTFNTPANIGTDAITLTVSAGVNGTLTIFVPATDNDLLFSPDLFGDNITVRLDERYVSACLQASLAVGVGVTQDKLLFGFNGRSAVNLTYCQRFKLNPVTPPVLESVKQTLAHFTIPAALDDISALQEGSVAAVDGTGDLKFSGTVNLLTFVNPLASVNVPVGSALNITAGGAVAVGAAYEYSGDYQIRVLRLAGNLFHLGFYRRRQNDFSVNAGAFAGITTTSGTTTPTTSATSTGPTSLDSNPLFMALLNAISSRPKEDQNELAAGGLDPTTITAIHTALQSAIDRTLSLAVTMEVHDILENDAMFLYEVDLSALTSDGKDLLEKALHGDLSDLVARDHSPGPGIRVLKTVIGSNKTLKHIFKVNLLGIYNALSISSLLRTGTAAWDATTGEYILTDAVTASRLGVNSVNFGANSDKLRNLLAENLLITAGYRAGAFISGQPSLNASHTYFALSVRTNLDQLRHDLFIGLGLGFGEAAAAVGQLSAHVQQLGRTTVLAEAVYDDAAFNALFFDGTRQREASEYDRAGRNAIKFLTRPGDPDEYRLRIAENDTLWARMRELGNVQSGLFRQLFPDLPVDAVTTIGVDYLNIVWWSDAMIGTGQKLQAMRQYLLNPNTSRADPQFVKLKEALASQLATLAGRTRQDFGGPWGLLAMSSVAPRPGRKFFLLNPRVTLTRETQLPAPASSLTKGATK